MPIAKNLAAMLRTCVLALTVFGSMLQPVLNQIGELHSAEHALLADSHDAHHPDESTDETHTQGMHGLFHQAGLGFAYSELSSEIRLPEAHATNLLLAFIELSPIRERRSTQPFRPPIV
jgi:hypothetical protein